MLTMVIRDVRQCYNMDDKKLPSQTINGTNYE